MSCKPNLTGGPKEGTNSLDVIFNLLSKRPRRELLRFFRDTADDIYSFDELTEHLHRVEREKRDVATDKERLLTMLVHTHCPKLEEAGLIEYDVKSRDVRYYSNEDVERLLDHVDEWKMACE